MNIETVLSAIHLTIPVLTIIFMSTSSLWIWWIISHANWCYLSLQIVFLLIRIKIDIPIHPQLSAMSLWYVMISISNHKRRYHFENILEENCIPSCIIILVIIKTIEDYLSDKNQKSNWQEEI